MVSPAEKQGSENTQQLEMKSIQLEILALQQNREIDKKEFSDFALTANNNFVSIQSNFDLMQTNFEKLLAAVKGKDEQQPPLETEHAKGNVVTTPEHGSVNQPLKIVKPIGTSKLQDIYGRDLQLDGTAKQTYKHPNAKVNPPQGNRSAAAGSHIDLGEDDSDGDGKRETSRFRAYGQHELRRMNPVCKPAKLNIPEFDGDDACLISAQR